MSCYGSCLPVSAQEPAQALPELLIKPTRCIALHQGQTCYQKLTIRWRTSISGDYCLYQKGKDQAIFCWQPAAEGSLVYEFSSDTTQTLQLINMKNRQAISETAIQVAWVYNANTRRKTHWRLF